MEDLRIKRKEDFHFVPLAQQDPSTADGSRVIYEREVPVELRYPTSTTPGSFDSETQESSHVGVIEAVKVKILVFGEEGHVEGLKLELMSEKDLFFHYVHKCTEADFPTVQEEQKLMIEFSDYSNVLMRMLNHCIKQPQGHLAVLVLNDAQSIDRLEFIQNMEYKFVELLSCQVAKSSEEVIQKTITYRYNAMKTRLSMMNHRLQEVNDLVKLKNPSLLMQLQKSSCSSPPTSTK